jgi:hypothetical protein
MVNTRLSTVDGQRGFDGIQCLIDDGGSTQIHLPNNENTSAGMTLLGSRKPHRRRLLLDHITVRVVMHMSAPERVRDREHKRVHEPYVVPGAEREYERYSHRIHDAVVPMTERPTDGNSQRCQCFGPAMLLCEH